MRKLQEAFAEPDRLIKRYHLQTHSSNVAGPTCSAKSWNFPNLKTGQVITMSFENCPGWQSPAKSPSLEHCTLTTAAGHACQMKLAVAYSWRPPAAAHPGPLSQMLMYGGPAF